MRSEKFTILVPADHWSTARCSEGTEVQELIWQMITIPVTLPQNNHLGNKFSNKMNIFVNQIQSKKTIKQMQIK
jgi:hypothetical protein